VIVDELHAFAADDRGWHLRSVLHRLDQYLHRPLQRIGLSATVSNPQELLEWFAPTGPRPVVGSASVSTDADVTIDHVSSLENAATVISRLHRGQKRLVFCDSRSSAEQLCSMLRAREIQTFLSHASLSAAERRQAEAAFVEGRDCAIVATSTLELGIDVGDLDKVIQIDAPSTVSSFLQRMGRTGRRADSRRNCLFLTTNDNALLLALGIAQRWSEAWVEAARPPAQPWPSVAQQAMAAVLERGELPNHELIDLLQGSFPELARAETAHLVEHLVSIGILDRVAAVVRTGPRMEKEFGKGHYRDLLASFSGSMLLTGRHGSAEVGYIDPTVLAGEKETRLILLGGRSWRVTGIEWSKKTVWLEPAKEGGKARWMGGARSLSREVCQGMRTVLAEGPPSSTTLSRRARTAFELLRDELCISRGTHFIVSRPQEAAVRTWTFAGTRANRTHARHATGPGGKVKFDALSVQAPASALAPTDGDDLVLTDDELSVFAETIKFSSCLPRRLLAQTVIARAFEVCGPGD
jgi:ATP-dependent Lhr-like helicase